MTLLTDRFGLMISLVEVFAWGMKQQMSMCTLFQGKCDKKYVLACTHELDLLLLVDRVYLLKEVLGKYV